MPQGNFILSFRGVQSSWPGKAGVSRTVAQRLSFDIYSFIVPSSGLSKIFLLIAVVYFRNQEIFIPTTVTADALNFSKYRDKWNMTDRVFDFIFASGQLKIDIWKSWQAFSDLVVIKNSLGSTAAGFRKQQVRAIFVLILYYYLC